MLCPALQLLNLVGHQLRDILQRGGIKGKAPPGGLVELGDGARPAQREGVAILLDRALRITQVVTPDLERSNRSESILNKVEGDLEEVQNRLPAHPVRRLQFVPIDIWLKAPTQFYPFAAKRLRVQSQLRILIHPVLKGITLNKPRHCAYPLLQMLQAQAPSLFLATEPRR